LHRSLTVNLGTLNLSSYTYNNISHNEHIAKIYTKSFVQEHQGYENHPEAAHSRNSKTSWKKKAKDTGIRR
ncbi:MAG: hypothetical protein KAV69_03230, partial [Deltaproteobacteria bacterium]|nr:hypothetical protein [Deltaproteobacteria bacterium]